MPSGPLRALTLAPLLSLAACSPEVPVGDRPDARAGNDAALAGDAGGSLDGGADAGAALDAFVSSDAPVGIDAFVAEDAFVSSDAGRDAATSPDAGRDAATSPDSGPRTDAGPSWAVGFCRVQFPTTIMAAAGASTTVFGRVYVLGLTDRTGRTDTDASLRGEVGSGPDGSDPSSPGWTWASATANAGYGPGAAGYEANNDEYQADLSRPTAGSYDFAYRFSGDAGRTWTYCDTLGPGSSDGYQVANAGSLTVL